MRYRGRGLYVRIPITHIMCKDVSGTMQNYENITKNGSACKKIVLEFLDFLRFKVEHDLLTMEETESLARSFEEGLNLVGTSDDLARFYGKPKTNVTSVIDRRMSGRPVRRVLYSFNAFRRVVPEKWRKE